MYLNKFEALIQYFFMMTKKKSPIKNVEFRQTEILKCKKMKFENFKFFEHAYLLIRNLQSNCQHGNLLVVVNNVNLYQNLY